MWFDTWELGGWVNWKGDSKAIGKGHSGGQASIEGETC